MITIRPDVVVQPALEAWEVFFLAAAGAGAVLLLQAGIAAAPEVISDLARWYRHLRRRAKLGGAISPLELTAEDPSTFDADREPVTSILHQPPTELDPLVVTPTGEAAWMTADGLVPASIEGEPTVAHDVLADAAWQANGRVPEVPDEARKRWVATKAGLHFKGCRYSKSGDEIDATTVEAAAAHAMGHRPPLRICSECHPLSLAAPVKPPAGKTVLT